MQNLMLRYSTWFNKKRRRIGHLFQGRYKAILIDADAYLLELVRYIHLNPVRAKMVKLPDEHPWSGHLALLGKEVLPWFYADYVLSLFDSEVMKAAKKYGDFVYAGLSDGTRPEFGMGTHEGRLLGDDTFADEALSHFDFDSLFRAPAFESPGAPPAVVAEGGVVIEMYPGHRAV